MKYLYQTLALFILFSTYGAMAKSNKLPKVVLETNLGKIILEINTLQAPNASSYFLSLVEKKLFDGTSFYRAGLLGDAIKPQVIQGGLLDKHVINGVLRPLEELNLPTLADFETTAESGLTHQYATISLARDLFGSGDAIPDLVICVQRLPILDYNASNLPDNRGFPAFGRVIKGMDIVKKIVAQPSEGITQIKFLQGQILTNPVKINRVYLQ